MSSPSMSFLIHDFLAQRRIAVAGVSRQPKDFSRGLFRELKRRHYDVVPVNPGAQEIEGEQCFARIQDVLPRPDAVLVMTSPSRAEQVVHDCIEAGVTRVWLHRGVGTGAVSEAAVALCRESGIRVIDGACPYMFLPEAGAIHRLHGGLLRLFHRHPAQHTPAA